MSAPPDAFATEYEATVSGCGWRLLEDWSVVTLTGADRQKFLHNMCTNDIRKLTPGAGCEAFLTDVKGKIVAQVFIVLGDHQIEMLSVPGQAPRIISHLERYIIREDVQLADLSAERVWSVLTGARTESVLGVRLDRPWLLAQLHFLGADCCGVRFPLPGRMTYLLGGQRDELTALPEELDSRGAVACGDAAWNAVRVEEGLPLFGVDFDDTNLPQEISRDAQAISFTKGCYLGQETIARIDALGHVNKQIISLKFAVSAQPQPGVSLSHSEQPVGTVTTVGWSLRAGTPLGLAMVRRGSNAVGTRLDSAAGSAEVTPTPFFG